MSSITNALLTNEQLGLSSIFLALFLLMFYSLRKDAKSHKEEYKSMSDHMFAVLENNTKSNTKLCESIKDLKDRVS